MSTPSEPIIYKRPLTLSNSVELYWYPPTNDGGNVITSYIIECSNISYINVLPSSDRKSVVNNLTSGTSYVFTIKATNINGNGNISSFNFVIPGYKPDYPTNLDFSVNVTDYSNIYYTFNNPVFIGNSAITYNTVSLIPKNVSGNTYSTSAFNYNYSTVNSNIMDPVISERINTNLNYISYFQSTNTVNDSDKNFNYNIVNPKLPSYGLKLWLDPYDLSTLTLSNSKVVKWDDKSKNKSNATISSTFAPFYDSANCLLTFTGTQYLNLPNNTIPSGNSSYSIFTYVSTSNISLNNQWFLHSGSPSSNLTLGGLINSNIITQSWFSKQQISNVGISNDISYLIEFNYDSGVRSTFLNGTLVAQDSGNLRNSTSANNIIGSNSNLTANLFGTVGDIIIYDRILTSKERLSVRDYLEKKKYNLALNNFGNLITWLDATDSNNLYDATLEYKASYHNHVYNWLDRGYANNNASQSNVSLVPLRKPNYPIYNYGLGGNLLLSYSNVTINSQNESNIGIFLKLSEETNYQSTGLRIFNSSNVNITSTAIIKNRYAYYWGGSQIISFTNIPLSGYTNPTELFKLEDADIIIPVQPNSNYRIDFSTDNTSGLTQQIQYAYIPYYNNDSLLFNNSYLTIPTSSYPIDAFVVLKLSNIYESNDILGISPNSNNYSSLSYSNRRFNINATSNSLISSTIENSNNYLLLEWGISNNNNFIRKFGSNIANTTIGTWTLPNNSNIIIGNSNGFDFTNRFKGYIGEIMMFNRHLINEDRQQIEGYLAWKWGLQSFLPSNHLYKNSAPYLFYKYTSIVWVPIGVPGYYTSNSGYFLAKESYATTNNFILTPASTNITGNIIRTYAVALSSWTHSHDKDLDTNVYYTVNSARQVTKTVLDKGLTTFTNTVIYTDSASNITTSPLGNAYAPSCMWTSTVGYGAVLAAGFTQSVVHVFDLNSNKTGVITSYRVPYVNEVYGVEVIPKGASGFSNNYGVAYTRGSKQMSSWIVDMSNRSWTNRVDNSYSTSPAGTNNGCGMIYYPPGKQIFAGDTDVNTNRIAFTTTGDQKLYVWNITETTNDRITWIYSKTITLTGFGNGPTPYHMSENAYNSIS